MIPFDNSRLRQFRSLLFLPASNPRAIEKARTLDADLVILDLEDAVREEDKDSARAAAIEATAQGFAGKPVAIRVNSKGSPHFGADYACVRKSKADYVVLAKVDTPKEIHDARSLMERPVMAMIETPRGVLDAVAIARDAAAFIAGTNDLSASLGIPDGAGRSGLAYALQRIVLAARAAGIAAFDGVYNRLESDEGLAAECVEGRAYGFDGKSVIHPSQIATVNRIFAPSPQEVEAARRLIEAAGGGAERHDGRMIEDLHVAQARALLAKAGG
ncbi:CoA ester lyase [Sphingosinicella ginsenosidimutans]|uniref:CoA ester lyase n=1 Tax=Allosphingosinicella ginsenosidimutans TaxID=1176539 RepID=A0A5C6TW58_9SPHN|nr:CoA ester lyase [Sphingosinicella ginsenosidimutans]TXC64390.1 CoA ester lyase [Sphingosinicella ginsenosidimutans]